MDPQCAEGSRLYNRGFGAVDEGALSRDEMISLKKVLVYLYLRFDAIYLVRKNVPVKLLEEGEFLGEGCVDFPDQVRDKINPVSLAF